MSVPVAIQPEGMAKSNALSAAKLFGLGQKYYRGEDVAQDDEEAAYYYKKAAELGHARAQLNLGMMYANGRGVPKDFDEAIYWIQQASDLAQLAWHDAAVVEAASWLQAAAGHGYTPASRTLELMTGNEKLGAKNSNNSIFWFRKSAALGNTRAQPARPPLLLRQES